MQHSGSRNQAAASFHIEHICEQSYILNRILDVLQKATKENLNEAQLRQALCEMHSCAWDLLKQNQCALSKILEHMNSSCIGTSEVLPILQQNNASNGDHLENSKRDHGTSQHLPLFSSMSFQSLNHQLQQSGGPYKLTLTRTTPLSTETVAVESDASQNLCKTSHNHPTSLQRLSYVDQQNMLDVNRQISNCSGYSSLNGSSKRSSLSWNQSESDSYDSSAIISRFPQFTSTPCNTPNRLDSSQCQSRRQSFAGISKEDSAFHSTDYSNLSSVRTTGDLRRLHMQASATSTELERNSAFSGRCDRGQCGSRRNSSRLSEQHVRQVLFRFIKIKLPNTNHWFEFERIGLKLPDETINRINDDHKGHSFAQKFQKLQAWAKDQHFVSEEELESKLCDAIEEMNRFT